jgi:probable HAF family extracellular repeat protein
MLRTTRTATGAPQANRKAGNMKPLKCLGIGAITLLALLAVPRYLKAQNTQTAQKNTVVDLGTLGGTFSLAGGLNEEGDVEGFSTLSGDTAVHAVLWRKGKIIDRGTLGGPNSTAAFSRQ